MPASHRTGGSDEVASFDHLWAFKGRPSLSIESLLTSTLPTPKCACMVNRRWGYMTFQFGTRGVKPLKAVNQRTRTTLETPGVGMSLKVWGSGFPGQRSGALTPHASSLRGIVVYPLMPLCRGRLELEACLVRFGAQAPVGLFSLSGKVGCQHYDRDCIL